MKVPFSKIVIGAEERRYVNEVLDSGWLTTASKSLEFEKRFGDFVGGQFACAVNSCTAALHLGLDALGLKPGDSVFIPTMTFTATAEVVRYFNADIVPLDVEYGTNLITPEILKEAIEVNPTVKFLIVVHYGGQAANMTEIMAICANHGIKVMEDAAHAFPSRHNGRMIGTLSDVTCFSFYANKTITTGEGGMVVTNDESLYRRIKTMRLHGINRDIWDRFTSKTPSWEYDVVDAGYKYNLPDLASAIGLGQLEKAELLRKQRQNIVEIYYRELDCVNLIDLPICHCRREEHAWHLFQIVIKPNSSVNRNVFIEKMAELNIGTSVHYKPIHRLTYYRNKYGLDEKNYPSADRTWLGTVSLPLFAGMTEEEVLYVCNSVKSILLSDNFTGR